MADVLGTAYIDVKARLTNFEQQTRAQAATAMSGATQEVTKGATAMEQAAGSVTGKMSTQFSKSLDGISSKARRSFGDVTKAQIDLTLAQDKFGKGSLEAQLASSRLSGAQSGLSRALSGSASAASHSTGMLKGLSGKLQELTGLSGKTLGFAGLAVGAVEAVKSAGSFQTATVRMADSAGVSNKAAASLANQFLATAGKSVYSARTIMEAYTPVAGQLASVAGHALTNAQAMQVMTAAQDLAEATGQDLTTSTKSLAKIMQTFQVPTKDAATTVSQLYEASRITNNGVGELSQVMTRLKARMGPVAPSVGQLGSLIVDMANHGVTGSRSLMILNSAVTKMLDPSIKATQAQMRLKSTMESLPPSMAKVAQSYEHGGLSSKQLTAYTKTLGTHQLMLWKQFMTSTGAVDKQNAGLKALGISVMDSHGKFAGMGSIIAQLHDKIRGMSQQQQIATLSTVFGTTAARTLLSVVQAGPAAYDKATAAVNKQDAAHKAAENSANTFEGQLKKTRAALSDMTVQVGNALLPVMQGLLRALQPVVKVLSDVVGWLIKNKDVVGPLIAALGAFIGVVMLGNKAIEMWRAAMVIMGITEAETGAETTAFTGIMGLFNAVMDANPVVLVVAALAALAIGAYEAYQHFGPFRAIINDIGRFFKTVFVDSIHIAIGVFNDLKGAFSAVLNFFLHNPWSTALLGPIGIIIAAIRVLAAHWSTVWHGMLQVAGEIVGLVIQDVIRPIVMAFLDFARSIIDSAASAFGWVPGIGGKLKHARAAIDGFVSHTGSTLQGWANDAFKWGHDAGSKFDDGIIGGLSSKQKQVYSASQGIAASVLTGAKGPHGLNITSPSKPGLEIGKNFADAMGEGMTRSRAGVMAAAANVASAAANAAAAAMASKAKDVAAAQAAMMGRLSASVAPGPSDVNSSFQAYMPAQTAAMGAAGNYGTAFNKATQLQRPVQAIQQQLQSVNDQPALVRAKNAATAATQAYDELARRHAALSNQLTMLRDAAGKHTKAIAGEVHALKTQIDTTRIAETAAKAHATTLTNAYKAADKAATTSLQHQLAGAKAAEAAARTASDAAKQAMSTAEQAATAAAQTLVQNLQQQASALKQAMDQFNSTITQDVQGSLGDISSIWGNLTQTAQQAAQDATNAAAALASASADQVVQAGAAAAAAAQQATIAAGNLSAQGLIAALQQNLQTVQQFGAELQQLAAAGLNQAGVQQIAGMGAAAGGQIAQSILNAGPGAIGQINDLMNQIATTAGQAGSAVTDQFYGTAVQAMSTMIATIKRQAPALGKALDGVAQTIAPNAIGVGTSIDQGLITGIMAQADAIATSAAAVVSAAIAAAREAAKAKSPSQEMWKLGNDMTTGLALALQDGSDVHAAASGLVRGTLARLTVPTMRGLAGLSAATGGVDMQQAIWLQQRQLDLLGHIHTQLQTVDHSVVDQTDTMRSGHGAIVRATQDGGAGALVNEIRSGRKRGT